MAKSDYMRMIPPGLDFMSLIHKTVNNSTKMLFLRFLHFTIHSHTLKTTRETGCYLDTCLFIIFNGTRIISV